MTSAPAHRTRMVVEAGKVREFAEATGSQHPAYTSRENPSSSPATFLITKRFWQRAGHDPWASLGLDPSRVLHAEESYEFFGPPPAPGTVLDAESSLGDVVTKPGRRGGRMRFATVVTDFYDEQGTLRARSSTTIVETEKPPTEES